MFPGWPGAGAFATGLVFPFVLAASSAAMIAAGAATRKSQHPVRPVHDRRGSGRHPGQPLTWLPAGRWTG